MPRPRMRADVHSLVDHINRLLKRFDEEQDGLLLRDKVFRLVEVLHKTKDLGVSVARSSGIDGGAAKERLRLYLCEFCELPIKGDELEVVAGISEYARRVRQLRVEEGYRIGTGA